MSYDEPWTCNGCGTGNVGRAFCVQCGRPRAGPKIDIPPAVETAAPPPTTSGRPGVTALVVLAVLAVAVAVVIVLTRTPADQRRADRAVVRRSDLAGAWKVAHPPSTTAMSRAWLGRQSGGCAEVDGYGWSRSASAAFLDGDPTKLALNRVGSAVLVYHSGSDAARALAYLGSTRFRACLSKSLAEETGHDLIDTSAAVSTQSITRVQSAAGTGPVLRLHAIVRLTTKDAIVDMTTDVTITRNGRYLAINTFTSDTGAFPASAATRIVDIVDRRLR